MAVRWQPAFTVYLWLSFAGFGGFFFLASFLSWVWIFWCFGSDTSFLESVTVFSMLLLVSSIDIWTDQCLFLYQSLCFWTCIASFGPYGTLFIELWSIFGGSCKWYCFAYACNFSCIHWAVHLLLTYTFWSLVTFNQLMFICNSVRPFSGVLLVLWSYLVQLLSTSKPEMLFRLHPYCFLIISHSEFYAPDIAVLG